MNVRDKKQTKLSDIQRLHSLASCYCLVHQRKLNVMSCYIRICEEPQSKYR